MTPEPLDYGDILDRWDALTKAELWAFGTGELHNIIDLAVERLDELRTRIEKGNGLRSSLVRDFHHKLMAEVRRVLSGDDTQ